MPLPEHLHPRTYWEERCSILEQAVVELSRILAYYLPERANVQLAAHAEEWNRLHAVLTDRYSQSDLNRPQPTTEEGST